MASKGNPGAMDVNAMVHRAVQVMERDRGACIIETELGSELPLVKVDAEQLRQVLMNLVRNAMQSMNGRGVVRICSRCHGGPGLERWIEIAVRDEGAGIAPQVLKNLFVPFFTTKEVGKGTGQGLSLSRSLIVDRHAGVLGVDSTPGVGTTFTVRLPVNGLAATRGDT